MILFFINYHLLTTGGIVNSGFGSLRNFCTFNRTKLTGDMSAALNSATGHTANRWAQTL
jgi:hypothetical protein